MSSERNRITTDIIRNVYDCSRPVPNRPRGISLMETVIAAGVIALIVMLTLGLIPSFKLANRRANMDLQAGALAQSHLEKLRLTAYADTSATPNEEVKVDNITYRISIRESDQTFSGTPPVERSKRVRVVVQWSWRDRNYSVFRETILCRLLRS